MTPARVGFAGTSAWAADALGRLDADPALDVALVLTQPDRPAGRGRALRRPPVAVTAGERGIAVLQPERPLAALAAIRAASLGAMAVVAYGELVPHGLLDALPWLNLHPSRLPRWRGAAPIERALMAGEDELAACVILLVQALDAGPIAASAPFTLAPDEDAVDAYRRSLELGAPLLAGALADAVAGDLATSDQVGEPIYAAKLAREDLALDPAGSWRPLHARVRALAATTGGRLLAGGRPLTVWKTRPAEASVPAATLAFGDGRVLLGTADGALELVEVQPAGRTRMDAAAWARGLRGVPPAVARP